MSNGFNQVNLRGKGIPGGGGPNAKALRPVCVERQDGWFGWSRLSVWEYRRGQGWRAGHSKPQNPGKDVVRTSVLPRDGCHSRVLSIEVTDADSGRYRLPLATVRSLG